MTAALVMRNTPWIEGAFADYRTSIGERREIVLEDGSRVLLNTSSAVNVGFTADQRAVHFIEGEIMIATGHLQTEWLPFYVRTSQGLIQALGTRFSVRQDQNFTTVSVSEHAVMISLRESPATQAKIFEGEGIRFTHNQFDAKRPVSQSADGWTHGQIIADDMALADFITELNRYRCGVVRCGGDAAWLKISGVFPHLTQTEF